MRKKTSPGRPARVEVSTSSASTTLGKLKRWLADALHLSEGEQVSDAFTPFVEAAYETGLAKLNEQAIRNEHLEAEIRKLLAQARREGAKSKNEVAMAGSQRMLVEAQAHKTRAEADAIERKSKLDFVESLHRLGFDVTPVIQNGEIVSLFVSKRPELPEPQQHVAHGNLKLTDG